MFGFYEVGNEPLGSAKDGKFFVQLIIRSSPYLFCEVNLPVATAILVPVCH